jgi:hypothetical protein
MLGSEIALGYDAHFLMDIIRNDPADGSHDGH